VWSRCQVFEQIPQALKCFVFVLFCFFHPRHEKIEPDNALSGYLCWKIFLNHQGITFWRIWAKNSDFFILRINEEHLAEPGLQVGKCLVSPTLT
jgi:hypothetical protein